MADCYYHGQSSPGPCPQCRGGGSGPAYRPPGYGLGRKWGSTLVSTAELKCEGNNHGLQFAVLLAQRNLLAVNWHGTNQVQLWTHRGHDSHALEEATEELEISTVWSGKQWQATGKKYARPVAGRTRKEAAWRLFVMVKLGPEVAVPNELLRFIGLDEKPPAELNLEHAQ